VAAAPAVVEDEWVDEVRMVAEEYFDEEPFERTEYRTVTEDRLVPQVKGIYAFEGQGMTLAKGEVPSTIFFFTCLKKIIKRTAFSNQF